MHEGALGLLEYTRM